MTATDFAAAMEVDKSTVFRWLRLGLVPGAELIEPAPGVTIWQIPQSALKMERPRAGRKRAKKDGE